LFPVSALKLERREPLGKLVKAENFNRDKRDKGDNKKRPKGQCPIPKGEISFGI
jgi:hypothetical protein